MNLTNLACIVFSGSLLIAAVVLFILSRRSSSSEQSLDSNQDHAVLDDRGDKVLWELGQGFPLVDLKRNADILLQRRALFTRVALGLIGTFVSWRMARGSTDTQLLKKIAGTDGPEAPNPFNRAESIAPKTSTGTEKEMALMQDQSHGDSHNDFVIHGDNMMPDHYDVNARNGHVDMDQHDDTSGHVDVHSDSSN